MNPHSIPSLPQLATPAPPVVAGALLNLIDFVLALGEVEEHRHASRVGGPQAAITDVHVAEAAARALAVLAIHTEAMFTAPPPPWVEELRRSIQDAIDDLDNDLHRLGNRMDGEIHRLEHRMDEGFDAVNNEIQRNRRHIRANRDEIHHNYAAIRRSRRALEDTESRLYRSLEVNRLQAQAAHEDIVHRLLRVRNRLDGASVHVRNIVAQSQYQLAQLGSLPLAPFRKVNPGIGPNLPGYDGQVPAELPVVDVGDVVPARYFPADQVALEAFSHEQINTLSMLLNEDFGIQLADSLAMRRICLRAFLAM